MICCIIVVQSLMYFSFYRTQGTAETLATALQSILNSTHATLPMRQADSHSEPQSAAVPESAPPAAGPSARASTSWMTDIDDASRPLGRRELKKIKGKMEGKKEKDQTYVVEALAQKIRKFFS